MTPVAVEREEASRLRGDVGVSEEQAEVALGLEKENFNSV